MTETQLIKFIQLLAQTGLMRRGCTISSLAKELSMQRPNVTKLLHNENTNPTLKTVHKLLTKLGWEFSVVYAASGDVYLVFSKQQSKCA